MRADAATAAAHLDQALAEISAVSGVSMASITRTCIGTAGESVSLVTGWLREAIGSRVGGDLLLLGDVEIALDAAFPGAPGVLVLAGTGSNIAGRDAQGRLTSAGGWGPALADQGSGHRIGHRALRSVFLAIDEGQPTLLLEAILEFWELASVEALVEFANQLPAPDFSRLTHLVLQCAEQGDTVAQTVLQREGEALAHLVCIVMRRLCQTVKSPDWTPPLAFAGSIMERVAPVRAALLDAVKRQFPDVLTTPGVVDPITGALWRARTGR
jgi:N-acetylglucosamine kinase-like BadF-type ATPase